MSEPNNILSNCRLCQSRNGEISFINNVEFINQVYFCTNIKLDDDIMDNMPETVCNECKISIENFFKFREEFRKVDEFLRKHIKTMLEQNHLSSKKQYKCNLCSKSYIKLSSLHSHKLIHNKLHCIKCRIRFDSEVLLKEHKCNKKGILNKNTTPDIKCTESINSNHHDLETDLLPNLKQEFVEDATNISLEGLERTDKECIQEICVCKYPNCNKKYSSRESLKTHEMKHQGKRFLCVICGKVFITRNSLTCHEKTHLDTKAYACKLCNKAFTVKSNLRTHEKKYHEGVRFYCSQCPKVFINKDSLERHEKVHTGIREFPCSNCTSAFYTSKELSKHQRYHEGLKQYKCDICFKTFFEKHHLVIHTRSHTGERPYICKLPGCGKSFAESQKLTRHLRAKHPSH